MNKGFTGLEQHVFFHFWVNYPFQILVCLTQTISIALYTWNICAQVI